MTEVEIGSHWGQTSPIVACTTSTKLPTVTTQLSCGTITGTLL